MISLDYQKESCQKSGWGQAGELPSECRLARIIRENFMNE